MFCFALGTCRGLFFALLEIAQNAYFMLNRKIVFLMYEAAAMPL